MLLLVEGDLVDDDLVEEAIEEEAGPVDTALKVGDSLSLC